MARAIRLNSALRAVGANCSISDRWTHRRKSRGRAMAERPARLRSSRRLFCCRHRDVQAERERGREAADLLNISRGAAYAAAKRGDLPTVRIGGRILVPLTALMRLLEGHT